MFMKQGCFWRFVPMLSPDDGGGEVPTVGADNHTEQIVGIDGGVPDGQEKETNNGNEELAKLKLELAKQKEAINKATKEAADYKRQLRAKQSAEEIAAEEQKAQEEATKKEIEELRKEVARTKTIKNVMVKLGTDEEVSGKIAEYLYGAEDIENALTEIQRAWAAQEKKLRLEYGKIPAPGAGSANGEDEGMRKAIELAKELGRERAGSGKSLKDTLGNFMR